MYGRSPIHHVEGLNCPVIFFQGLRTGGSSCSSGYDGRGSGRESPPWRTWPLRENNTASVGRKTSKRALDAELYFYGRIFGFRPADAIEPVVIRNL